jgi:putative membrane protein insertion efficiency factor
MSEAGRPRPATTEHARGASALQRGLTVLVRGYRYFLSPWLGSSCRFEPTCSAYALQALNRHGGVAGSYLALRRIARCHPWCEGGRDEVPERAPGLFSSIVAHPPSHGVGPSPSTSTPEPHP